MARTIVDAIATHEKISTILLVIFSLRFYAYDHDVYLKALTLLTLIMICSHSFCSLIDFEL